MEPSLVPDPILLRIAEGQSAVLHNSFYSPAPRRLLKASNYFCDTHCSKEYSVMVSIAIDSNVDDLLQISDAWLA